MTFKNEKMKEYIFKLTAEKGEKFISLVLLFEAGAELQRLMKQRNTDSEVVEALRDYLGLSMDALNKDEFEAEDIYNHAVAIRNISIEENKTDKESPCHFH